MFHPILDLSPMLEDQYALSFTSSVAPKIRTFISTLDNAGRSFTFKYEEIYKVILTDLFVLDHSSFVSSERTGQTIFAAQCGNPSSCHQRDRFIEERLFPVWIYFTFHKVVMSLSFLSKALGRNIA